MLQADNDGGSPSGNSGHQLTLLVQVIEPGVYRFLLDAIDREHGPSYETYGPIRLQRDPRESVDSFFAGLADLPGHDPEIAQRRLESRATELFRQRFPPELQRRLWTLRHSTQTLQIQSEEPWIPWELCKLEGEEGDRRLPGPFLCEAFAVTRFLPRYSQPLRLPLQRIAAVIISDDPKIRTELADLRAVMTDGHDLNPLPPRYAEIVGALTAGSYDGWHFAGHGTFDSGDPNRSALSLDGFQQLTPEDLSPAGDFGRQRPLVFLNACSTGRTDYTLTGVGGWAKAFLEAGAGAFLGSFWPIPTDPARRFALAFYRSFLTGTPLAEAVRTARQEIRALGDPTWLAYTVYANPAARCLAAGEGAAGRPAVPRAFIAPPPPALPGRSRDQSAKVTVAAPRGPLPSPLLPPTPSTLTREFEQDIAISYAGEDIELARELTRKLQAQGVAVFFAPLQQAALLGERLEDVLARKYSATSRYVAVLVSEHYPIKDWARFELDVARDEEKERKEAFILPLRLADARMVQIPSDKGYLDLRTMALDDVVATLAEKVRKHRGELAAREVFDQAFRDWKNHGFIPGVKEGNLFWANWESLDLDVDRCEFLLRCINDEFEHYYRALPQIDPDTLATAGERLVESAEAPNLELSAIGYIGIADPARAEKHLWRIYQDETADIHDRARAFELFWRCPSDRAREEPKEVLVDETQPWPLRRAAAAKARRRRRTPPGARPSRPSPEG